MAKHFMPLLIYYQHSHTPANLLLYMQVPNTKDNLSKHPSHMIAPILLLLTQMQMFS